MRINYIQQIRAFYDSLLTKSLSAGQIALWYALMHVNNKCAWIEWFSVPNGVLESLTGLSRGGIEKARNTLKQLGYIDFKSNGKKATSYKITVLSSNSIQERSETVYKEEAKEKQDSIQDSRTLNKLNKTKLNNNTPSTTTTKFDTIISSWNELGLQSIKNINTNTNRYAMLQARIKENGEEEVLKAIDQINKSSFLKGQNQKGWTITFDWFVKPNNFIKVYEGNYTDKEQANKDGEIDIGYTF